jgi:hypothetical protein
MTSHTIRTSDLSYLGRIRCKPKQQRRELTLKIVHLRLTFSLAANRYGLTQAKGALFCVTWL